MFHRTENLFMRPAWQEDAAQIAAALSDKTITRNLARVPLDYTLDDAREFLAMPKADGLPGFVLTLPEEDGAPVIGMCGLHHGQDGVSMGYWIAREHWGRGYASEAVRGVVEVARSLGHGKLVASHFVDNPASGRVLRKAGFSTTGVVRPGHSIARGGYDPVVCYEIMLSQDEDDGGSDGTGNALGDAMKQAA